MLEYMMSDRMPDRMSDYMPHNQSLRFELMGGGGRQDGLFKKNKACILQSLRAMKPLLFVDEMALFMEIKGDWMKWDSAIGKYMSGKLSECKEYMSKYTS